jgi:DNA-binding NarL/FixJ family response regulator
VIVVDDMLLIREGLAAALGQRGIDVVAQAADASQLVGTVRTHSPDAVILDIRMPPTFTDEGLQAAAALRATFPEVGILLLSQYLESSYAVRLLRDAPERVGYLLKDRVSHIATVVDALRRIEVGDTVIDPAIVSRVIARRQRGGGLADLSAREAEVLSLLAEGLSNRAISDRLSINDRTVETHIAQVFNKLRIPASPDAHRRVLAVLTLLRTEHSAGM